MFPIIFANIKPGTTIHSDMYSTYHTLGQHNDYIHLMVNHSISFTCGDVNTQMIESRWASSKGFLNRDGKTRKRHVQTKLDEFCVRNMFFADPATRFHKMGRILGSCGVTARDRVRF